MFKVVGGIINSVYSRYICLKMNVYLRCYWFKSRLVNPCGITGGWSRISWNQVESFVSCEVGWSLFVFFWG